MIFPDKRFKMDFRGAATVKGNDMYNRVLYVAAAVFAAVVLSGCLFNGSSHIPAVSGFDAEKYMGRWYEYARLPNRFEKGMSHVTADYSMRRDGKIKVVNSGIKNGRTKSIEGKARTVSGKEGTGELEVSFFPPFYSPYRVIMMSEDGDTVVVTGGSMDYLWILSREPGTPDNIAEIISFLKTCGYPVEKLIYPAQKS